MNHRRFGAADRLGKVVANTTRFSGCSPRSDRRHRPHSAAGVSVLDRSRLRSPARHLVSSREGAPQSSHPVTRGKESSPAFGRVPFFASRVTSLTLCCGCSRYQHSRCGGVTR
jgi:hypothetical protein